MTIYEELIREFAPGRDPRHVEAYMRCQHPTLDHLTREAFAAEVTMAVLCIEEGGPEMAELVAKSQGF